MYDFTNVDPVKCCTWLVLPTVYDESLSYGEQLNKFCKALNELIENNNNIPQYVAEMIQNYITSGAIDEVVRNILANYILNVKYPPKGITPAVGDGSADDTAAIQGCIDYAFNQGGGCIYFPYGKYLSRSLTLRSDVSLVGFDRYSTRIVQRGGDTKPLIYGGNVQNVQISNLTLDGNNEVQTDDLDVVNVLGKDCLFTNLVIKSGFQCFVYNGLGGNLQVDNVVFGGAVKKVAVINGKDSVQFSNVKFNELGKVQGECVLEVGASDGVYNFSSKAVSPLCISVSGSRNTFNCDIVNASSNFRDTGALNNFNVLGVEIKEQLAQGKSSSVGGSATEIISGSKTEDVSGSKTETIGRGKIENITGSKSEVISENKMENITGSKSESISENKVENISGNREIDIDGTDSIHVDGTSTINRGGYVSEVYGSSLDKRILGTLAETIDGQSSATYNSKRTIKSKDIDITASEIGIHLPNGNLSVNASLAYFNSFFNVVLHGADNTGTEPIDDIFDSVINTYGIAYFPKGTYLFSRQHALNNQTIVGCGNETIIKCTSLGLNGGSVNQYGGFNSDYNQMLFKLKNGCIASNLYFDNLDGGGFFINGNDNKINNCYISTKATLTGSTGYYAITIRNSYNIVIDSITIEMEDGNNRDGIHIESNTSEVFISNCWIKSGDDGIAFNALEGDGGSIHDIFVNNCRIGGYGVRFFGEEHTDIYNISINNCYIIVDSDITQSGCVRFSNTTNTISGTPIGDHGLFNNITMSNCFLLGKKDTNLSIYCLNSYVSLKITNCVCYNNIYYANSKQTTFINFDNCLLNGLIVVEDTTGSNTLTISNSDIIGIVKHVNSTLIATLNNANINSTVDIKGDNVTDVIKICNSLILPNNIILSSNGIFSISNTKTAPLFNITNGTGQYFITNLINHNGGNVIGNAGICSRITGGISVNALPTTPKSGDYIFINNLLKYRCGAEWLTVNMTALDN